MRIAIIGSGISGLGAAAALSGMPGRDLVLYERDNRAGGHAHTIDVPLEDRPVAVDTGFIVYNELNYPNLTALFDWADVDTIASDMSFALSSGEGAFEWCGRHTNPLSGLFAQKTNLLDPGFLRFLLDVRRFQKRAIADVEAGVIGEETLGAYLEARGFSGRIARDYVAPMGAAIWSMTPGETLDFPARAFMTFFNNHRLLQWDRPRWRTVKGGSRAYVTALRARLGDCLRLSTPVIGITRDATGVQVRDASGDVQHYDAAIVATHAPVALSLLVDATDRERAVLGAFRVNPNRVVVHTDTALMPRRSAAWAAWNALRSEPGAPMAITYWMNRLQSLPTEQPLFVTLNPDRLIGEGKTAASFNYDHPVYDRAAIAAQSLLPALQGAGQVWFAGAWTGYGFHEDGLRSGLAAAAALGGVAPWLR